VLARLQYKSWSVRSMFCKFLISSSFLL